MTRSEDPDGADVQNGTCHLWSLAAWQAHGTRGVVRPSLYQLLREAGPQIHRKAGAHKSLRSSQSSRGGNWASPKIPKTGSPADFQITLDYPNPCGESKGQRLSSDFTDETKASAGPQNGQPGSKGHCPPSYPAWGPHLRSSSETGSPPVVSQSTPHRQMAGTFHSTRLHGGHT